ncbi:MAG: MSHA biogenesis protein MshQ [Colwellia sp.]|jgi:MSHA biogenesis protein MshQ
MKQRQTIFRDGIFSNIKAIRWALLRLVALLWLLLVGLPAQAATDYVFSSTGPLLPVGCSINPASTNSYTCGVLTLAAGDTIAVGSTPVTITFTGAFTTAESNSINNLGAISDLNIITNGVLTLGANTILNANVTGTAAINIGIGSTIGGNLTASSTTGVVTLAVNTAVGGFIHTDAGAVTIGNSSTVGGDVRTVAGVVTLLTDINVGGDISTDAGAITIGDGSSTCGSVISTGAGIVTITTNIQVGGAVRTVAGAITIGAGSTVGGDVNPTGAGVVTLTNVRVGGKVETGAGAITLTDTRVHGTVAATGAGVVTLTNSTPEDTTLIVPTASACSITLKLKPLLEYRFDECSYTGEAGDVIDQTGNFNGDSNGILAPSTEAIINKSLDLSADNTSDWVDVPSSAVDGLNDFSVAVWFKTSEDKSQQEIFHALGNNRNDDELEIFLKTNNNNIVYIKVKDKSQELESNIELTDDNWHHLVLTRAGKDVCLFIDGAKQECVNGVKDGQLSVNNANAIVIGQEQDSFGGNFSTSQNFKGQLDEFKIFDVTLSANDIYRIYTNELAGNNFDGSLRQPEACSTLIAEYRFDEPSWNGSTGEVADTSNTGLDGTAIGNATTTLVTEGQVCRAGTFDGTGDYIDVTGIDSYLNTTASLSFWIKSSQKGNNSPWRAPGIIGVEQRGGGNDIFWGYLDGSGRIRIQKGNGRSAVSTAVINDVNWQHVVLTYDSSNGAIQVFVNGSLDSSAISQTGDVSKAFSSIGRIKNSYSNLNFMGQLDELMIFDSVISPSDVSSIYNNQLKGNNYDGSARVCPTPVVDHYEIVHDGQGLTCEAESVTIKAHDVNHNLVAPSASTTITLSTSITNDGWKLKSGNGSFNAVTAEYTFDGIETQVEFGLSKTTATALQDINIGVTDGTSTDLDGDLTEDKNLAFADTGFRFLVDNNSIDIPTQLSGKPSKAGYNASNLSLQAIKTSTLTGACEAFLASTKEIELVAECIDPIACAGKEVMINSEPINTQDDVATPSFYTKVSLDFSSAANNTARFDLTYPDAGKVQLHARYNIPDELGNLTGNYMLGSSNTFVVRPFGFYIDAVGNPKAENATGTKYKKAGEKFTANVTAIQWQAEDDNLNNDGIPDDDSNLSDNDFTPNFGREMMKEKVVLAHQLIEPSGGSLGSLSGNTITNFTQGKGQTTDLSWSEVGIINLTANLNTSPYIDANLTVGSITGSTPYVGRFIPEHFEQTIKSTSGETLGGEGSLTVNHNNNLNECRIVNWAYSGQLTDIGVKTQGSIRYFNPPTLTITAYNSADKITKNYIGDFAKLMFLATDTDNKISFKSPKTTHVNGLSLTGSTPELGEIINLGEGVLTYQLSENDHFVYTRNASSEVAPFKAAFELPFEVFKDSDGVTFKASTSIINYFETPKFYNLEATPSTSAFNNTVEIRFGRLLLKNSFGPETSNIPQQMQIEHFDGAGFIVTTNNSCVSYDASNISLTDTNTNISLETPPNVLGGVGNFVAGKTQVIELQATGADNQGEIGVSYDVYDWLKYDWDSNGVYKNPSAVATFGLFRGNDRIIYIREVYN